MIKDVTKTPKPQSQTTHTNPTPNNYKKWLEKGMQQGFEALEIAIHESQTFKLSLDKGKIDACVWSDVASAVIRGIFANKKTSIVLEHLTDSAFDNAFETLKENCQTITSKEPALIFEGSSSYPEVLENNFDFGQVPLEQKQNLLLQLEKTMLQSSHLQVTNGIIYQEVCHKKTLLNSKGLNLSHQNSFAYLYASAVFQKEGEIESYGKSILAKDFVTFNPVKLGTEIVEMGEKKLGAKSLVSQKYPVIFSNEMFADLLESFSDIFTGTSAYRNLTKLKDKVNCLIASEKVSIIDDPLNDGAYFKEKFDDEGVACQTKPIITKGVFQGFIHNLKTARIFKQTPTGNGFDGGTSMINCYLVPGKKSFSEMIEPIQNGIYITDLVGMHAGIKTVSGDFSLQASGFRIEKGKVTTPVKMIVVSGNFFDILKNVDTIANDFEFQTSGFGSSSVYVGDLNIGGK
ncbi:TldD/PmbA family protein [Mulberry dwarf phytoplasma]|uniref:TldD/PmbA family protein n=1 Tax=Mulberry dwarf phytoplasma TaxID=186171 RepID=UPI001D102675|nr:metallopeptidase TldD-related protein [Mulberry dwarf phytoplasma]